MRSCTPQFAARCRGFCYRTLFCSPQVLLDGVYLAECRWNLYRGHLHGILGRGAGDVRVQDLRLALPRQQPHRSPRQRCDPPRSSLDVSCPVRVTLRAPGRAVMCLPDVSSACTAEHVGPCGHCHQLHAAASRQSTLPRMHRLATPQRTMQPNSTQTTCSTAVWSPWLRFQLGVSQSR